jgi:hypothetical protein
MRLLSRPWVELSGEQPRHAFNDLVAINLIEAAALVREYLGDNPDRPVQNFETFYSVLGIGIVIHDEWTRNFALNLIFSNVPGVREAALSKLAWSWRGELSLTAQHVDGLIDQIMTSPASDFDNRERAMLLEVSRSPRRSGSPVANQWAICGFRDKGYSNCRAAWAWALAGHRGKAGLFDCG